jgi:nuclease S1
MPRLFSAFGMHERSPGGVELRTILVVLLLPYALAAPAFAWGPEGHSIVAEIAQRHLTPAAAQQVRDILENNASLASIANWADDYRALHPATTRWHFVDIPIDAQDYVEDRDYAPSSEGDCVIHEISRDLEALTSESSTPLQRQEALKFVVHFVGDVNQPLHTVKELQGYNQMDVCYFSSPAKNDCVATNLHTIWDVGLIRWIFYGWGGYVDYLESDWIPRQDRAALSAGTPVDWALEAHKAAREIAVAGVGMNDQLAADYLEKSGRRSTASSPSPGFVSPRCSTRR